MSKRWPPLLTGLFQRANGVESSSPEEPLPPHLSQASSDTTSEEADQDDCDQLLYMAQQALIQHMEPKAVALFEQAAALGSSDACLSLASIATADDLDLASARVAAAWFIKGLRLECAKASPFSSSAPISKRSSQLAAIAESPPPARLADADEAIDLDTTAHLAAGLCRLYRLGKVLPLSGKAKEGEVDVFAQGAQVASRLLQHPALVRKQDAFKHDKDHAVWLPSSVSAAAAADGPPSPETSRTLAHLTSTQQLRRAIYASLCYALALVSFSRAEDPDHDEAAAWFAKVVALEHEPGGPGTSAAEDLVGKARVRIEMIRFAKQKEREMAAHLAAHQPPHAPHRSPDLDGCGFSQRLLSARAALDSPDAPIEEQQPPSAPSRPTGTGRARTNGSQFAPASLPSHSHSHLANGKPGKKAKRAPKPAKFNLHGDASSAGTSSPLQSPIASPPSAGLDSHGAPTTFPFPSQPPPPTKQQQPQKPLRHAKSALDLLRPRAKALKPLPSTSSLSAELIGIAPSSHLSRAHSASLLSVPGLEDAGRPFHPRARSGSSASVQSLPHFQTFLQPPPPPLRHPPGEAASKRASMLGTAIRNSVVLSALAEMLPSTDGGEGLDALGDVRKPDAAGTLEALLKRDIQAEHDLKRWDGEYETDEESWPALSLVPAQPWDAADKADDVFLSHPLPPSPSPSSRSRTPVSRPITPSVAPSPVRPGLQAPAPTPRSGTSSASAASAPDKARPLELDPLLQALEMASKINVTAKCLVCRKRGVNFPACRDCGKVYCSRACRISPQSCGHNKR